MDTAIVEAFKVELSIILTTIQVFNRFPKGLDKYKFCPTLQWDVMSV